MKRPNLDRPTALHLMLPESVRTRLNLFLFSAVESRVPQGAYQRFVLDRIREFFDWKRLDLAPFGFPAGFFVAGPKDILDKLEARLREDDTYTKDS